MGHDPSTWDETIDSRDLVKRADELQAEIDDLEGEDGGLAAVVALQNDLKGLEKVIEELRDVGDDTPEDGMTLIRDDYFARYAMELADDICDTPPRNMRWPFDHIDWEAAADALKQDYNSVEFNGVTYWVR